MSQTHRHLVLFLLLTLRPFAVFSQNISLTPAKAAQVRDSLLVLPIVRQEANAWRQAYLQADSASQTKSAAAVKLSAAYQSCLDAENARSTQAAENANVASLWKKKAQARGWRLAGVIALALGYVAIRR